MYVLAVTGGIGSGKSTAARLFGERGAVVIDLDDLAKGLTGPSGPLVDAVAEAFGEDLRLPDGGGSTMQPSHRGRSRRRRTPGGWMR
jgi:dephospho-CoA kinase